MQRLNEILIRNKSNLNKLVLRYLNATSQLNAGKKWRQSVGLPKLQTARGALIDLPDYSFLDGRPAPLSVGQLKRKELQQKLAAESIEGLRYLNRAQELYEQEHSNIPNILPLIERKQSRTRNRHTIKKTE